MEPGTVIARRFRIEARIGAGAMGVVYRAHDEECGSPVALKLIHGSESPDRFAREASVLERIRHPNVVRYVAHGTSDRGEPFLAMEWVEGETLSARLRAAPLSPLEALRIAHQVALALAAAHAVGVVHRDVKPGNIMLAGGAVDAVRVLDFGIARLLGTDGELTATGVLIGTPAYMAPEQARSSKQVDERADVFGLGAVLFRCLTGRTPFGGGDIRVVLAKLLFEESPRVRALAPQVPQAVDEVVARMLCRETAGRLADGAQVADALEGILQHWTDEELTVPSPPSRGPALSRREQHLVGVVMTAGEGSRQASGSVSAAVRVLAAGAGEHTIRALRQATLAFEPHIEALADGSVVAVLSGTRGAKAQAIRTARCALAMQRALPGTALACVVGQARLELAGMVGEALERASQLLSAGADTDWPIVDDTTAALLEERFELGACDGGFSLQAERRVELGARTLIGKATSCVGRKRELTVLKATLEECVEDGVARVVMVSAPPGIGKSRLRHEFLRELERSETELQVWMARGDPVGVSSPLGALAAPIRGAAGIVALEGQEQHLRLRARVERTVSRGSAARVAEFLAVLLGVPLAAAESDMLRAARLDGRLMGEQIRQAVEELVAAECERGPLLLVLDDLQWVDRASVECVDALLGALSQSPFMVLTLGRPEVEARFPRLFERRAPLQLSLRGLSPRAAAELVHEALGADTAPDLVRRIVEQGEGNAFFLEELIRSASRGEDRVPASMVAVAQSRLTALDEEDRRILRAASIFGEAFWQGAIAALLGVNSNELTQRLETLGRDELLVRRADSRIAGEVEFTLWHALLREAAYAMLTPDDRQLGHGLAARWLEEKGFSDAAILAHHHELAGDSKRAVDCFARAAAAAVERNDLRGAIDLAERAVGLGAGGETLGVLRRLQQEAHRWTGEWELAEARGREARAELPRGSETWLRATSDLGFVLAARGNHDALDVLARDLGDALIGPLELAQIRAIVAVGGAQLWIRQGDCGDALLSRLDALGHAVQDDPRVAARLGWVRAQQAVRRGALDEARTATEHVIREFERIGEVRNACRERVSAAHGALLLGLWEEAEGHARDAHRQARRLRLDALASIAAECCAIALYRRGELDESRELLARSAEEHRARVDAGREGTARAYLAGVLREQQDAGALDEAERAASLSSESPREHAFALGVLLDCQIEAGRTDEANRTLTRLEPYLVDLGHWEERAATELRVVRGLEGLGRRADADVVARAAWQNISHRAAKIVDPELRARFVAGIAEHAELARRNAALE